ncbi:sugar efflux transporter SetB [Catellatospora sp. TT07R-123]|uniref:sugar efflux transporter n=1 Tax=Catellatospora sp. TT07R-123 TaxID=2733863 RepID=UPI001B25A270|nr:sugar efflux transporter [Catellatospora sp. TT07R-123]GHJ43243.1 sugar efflux transporter SetB [Catellatospora sp. TT07R-123]
MPRATAELRTGRPLVALGLIFITVGLSTAMAIPFVTLFLEDAVHASAPQVAMFLIAAPVSAIMASTLIGRVSDRLPDRRRLLMATAVAGCLAAALSAVVRDYWIFLVVAMTLTAAAGALMPQVFAYAREALHGSDRVAMTMSTLRTLFSIAWVAGPPLAAFMLTVGGFKLTYLTSSLMYATTVAVIAFGLRRPRPAALDEPDADTDAEPDMPPKLIWLSVAVFVLTGAAGNMAVQALPLLTARELGLGLGSSGLLLGLCAALEIPLMVGFGMMSTRLPIRRLLMVGAVCGLAYMALTALATSLWHLVLGQVLNAAAIAALSGLGITYMQDMLPRHRGRASTLFSNTVPVGALLAGPVLGAAAHTGYRIPYAAGVLLYAGALGLLALSGRTVPADSEAVPESVFSR